jgi:hypothetical protein
MKRVRRTTPVRPMAFRKGHLMALVHPMAHRKG